MPMLIYFSCKLSGINKTIFFVVSPRKRKVVLSKKFNLLKEVIDILSNPKLDAALGLLLTPTPLYEPSIEDIRRRDGISDKLYFSLEETEQPSDNQTE